MDVSHNFGATQVQMEEALPSSGVNVQPSLSKPSSVSQAPDCNA